MINMLGAAQIDSLPVEVVNKLIEAGIGVMAVFAVILIAVAGIVALFRESRRDKRDQAITDALLRRDEQQNKALETYGVQSETLKQLVAAMTAAVEDNRRQTSLIERISLNADAAAMATATGIGEVEKKLDSTAVRITETASQTTAALDALRDQIKATGDENTTKIISRLDAALSPLDALAAASLINTELATRRHEVLIDQISAAKLDIIKAFRGALETQSPPAADAAAGANGHEQNATTIISVTE